MLRTHERCLRQQTKRTHALPQAAAITETSGRGGDIHLNENNRLSLSITNEKCAFHVQKSVSYHQENIVIHVVYYWFYSIELYSIDSFNSFLFTVKFNQINLTTERWENTHLFVIDQPEITMLRWETCLGNVIISLSWVIVTLTCVFFLINLLWSCFGHTLVLCTHL